MTPRAKDERATRAPTERQKYFVAEAGPSITIIVVADTAVARVSSIDFASQFPVAPMGPRWLRTVPRACKSFSQGFPNLALYSPNFSKESFGGFVGFQRLAIAEGSNSLSPNFCGRAAAGRLRAEASQGASETVVRIDMVAA
jgi:hypothetical protein